MILLNNNWEQIETLGDFLNYIYNNFDNEFYIKTVKIINYIKESRNDEIEDLINENEDLNWEIECLEEKINDLEEKLRGD